MFKSPNWWPNSLQGGQGSVNCAVPSEASGYGVIDYVIVAAAAKSLQSCPTLCDPIDGSHQAPPSMGFSRQEYWSGVPLPSPYVIVK